MTLELEVGKWYRDGRGKLVYILKKSDALGFYGTSASKVSWYKPDGKIWYQPSNNLSIDDLVSEIEREETPYDLVSEIESENVPVFEPEPVEKEHVWYIEERFVDGEIKFFYIRTLMEGEVRACVENLLHNEPRIDTVAVFRQEFVAKRKTTVEFT